MLAGWELAIGLAALFCGSVVLGAVGFGLGIVAMPALLLIVAPREAVVIINAMIVLTTALTLAQTWRHLRLRQSWPFLLAGLPPAPLAVALLDTADPALLRLAIIALILALAVMSLFRLRLPGATRPWAGPVCGFITSLLVSALGIGGPLGGLYAIEQGWTRDTVRATLALYFVLASGLALTLYAVAGLVSATTAQNVGALALAVAAGAVVAGLVARRMSLPVFRYAVLAVTIGGSVSLLAREALRLF